MVRRSSSKRLLVVIMILTRMVSHLVSTYVTRGCLLRDEHRSVEHEFFAKLRCDQSCPPEPAEQHASGFRPERLTGVVCVTDAANGSIERNSRQSLSQIIKLGRVTLMTIVQEKRSYSRTRYE